MIILTNKTVKFLCIFLWLQASLLAKVIDTFYGAFDVKEPVLLELIESKSFQRLKSIHQYGVSYYTTHREEYTRYEHSLGVFALLRMHHASLDEQIAGLLHDVSHTTFSHVGDWIFHKQNHEKDYQNCFHKSFLEKYGLGEILQKYNFSIEQIMPLEEYFPMLEQKGPNLCADRIEYNIQGAFYQGFITKEECLEIAYDLRYSEGKWISSKPELMAKLARFSLFMTQNCWGSATNYLSSEWLAKAILRAFDLKEISFENIHFGVDQTIWDLLMNSEDIVIKDYMQKVVTADSRYHLVEPKDADMVIKSKFRGINPWIYKEGNILRLTEIDAEFRQEYETVQKFIAEGWAIKLQKS